MGKVVMIRRFEYRCAFSEKATGKAFEGTVDEWKKEAEKLVRSGKLVNASFYRHENMGFLYLEEVLNEEQDEILNPDNMFGNAGEFLRVWAEEEGDRLFVPMVKVYWQSEPENDVEAWEEERTTAVKTRIGRMAFVYPEKLTSYIMYHTALVNEGLNKGDKYNFISMHENILFSYYEEPRNNVNIRKSDEKSTAIDAWLAVDPESHFDRVKAKGSNFLVIPCLFSVDRLDIE